MSAMASRPIIAVLDTNVVIAGLLWEGPLGVMTPGLGIMRADT